MSSSLGGGGLSINAKLLFKKAADAAQASERLVDSRLNDQFKYFRREFMEAAISAGVTLPLELIEDRSGRFFSFVNSKGPKYLIYIMRTQPESSAILRSAISLLIVTLVILRRKLPDGANRTANWTSMVTGSVGSWVVEMLADVADGAAVSVCITLLMNSKLLIIQELVFSLLGMLINCSDEAALQMLTSPTYQQSSLKELEDRWRKELGVPDAVLTIDEKAQIIPEIKPTCLSVMFRIVANNRNHHSVVSSCADIVVAMCSYSSPAIARAIARTSAPKMLSHYLESSSTLASPSRVVKTAITPEEALIKQILSSKSKEVTLLEEGKKSAMMSPAKKPKKDRATWDALHIMVQFLHRFFRYASTDATSELVNSVPPEDRRKLIQAQNRIVVAVGTLVACAPDIGNYLFSVPKARSIVQNSAQYYLDSLPQNASISLSKEQVQAVRNVRMLVDILSDEFQALQRMDPQFAMESLMQIRDGVAGRPRPRLNERVQSPPGERGTGSPATISFNKSGVSSRESPMRRSGSAITYDDDPIRSRPASRSTAQSSNTNDGNNAYGYDAGQSPKSPARGGSPPVGSSPPPHKATASALMLRDLKSSIKIDTMSASHGELNESNSRPEIADRMIAPAPKLPPRLDAIDLTKRTPIVSRTNISQSESFKLTNEFSGDRPASASKTINTDRKTAAKADVVPKVLVEAASVYGVHHKANNKHAQRQLAPLSKGENASIGNVSETMGRRSNDEGTHSAGMKELVVNETNAPSRDARSREMRGKSRAAPPIAATSSSYDFRTGDMTVRSGGGSDGAVALFSGISLDGVGRATPLTAEQRSRPHNSASSGAGGSGDSGVGVNVQNLLNLSMASHTDEGRRIHAEASEWVD